MANKNTKTETKETVTETPASTPRHQTDEAKQARKDAAANQKSFRDTALEFVTAIKDEVAKLSPSAQEVFGRLQGFGAKLAPARTNSGVSLAVKLAEVTNKIDGIISAGLTSPEQVAELQVLMTEKSNIEKKIAAKEAKAATSDAPAE